MSAESQDATRAQVRPAEARDVPAIQEIYAYYVLNGLASFEEAAPTVGEMRQRYDDIVSRGLPYLVAELDGALAGYGYCAPYRTRSAYRYSVEDSVYVRTGLQGRGVGRALLAELIVRAEQSGYRQMIAVIGDSAHAASIGLHLAAGFVSVGILRSIGFKFGRWVDSVIMQRALGDGDSLPAPPVR